MLVHRSLCTGGSVRAVVTPLDIHDNCSTAANKTTNQTTMSGGTLGTGRQETTDTIWQGILTSSGTSECPISSVSKHLKQGTTLNSAACNHTDHPLGTTKFPNFSSHFIPSGDLCTCNGLTSGTAWLISATADNLITFCWVFTQQTTTAQN